MSNALPVLARWLHSVALALWLGGLIAIGALVAPAAFHVVRVNPAFAGHPDLQALIAGGIVGGSLRLFNGVSYSCGLLLILANVLLLKCSGRIWTIAVLLLTIVLLGTALYQGFGLFPALDLAQTQGNKALFDALHARYERVSTLVQLPLLLALTLCAALRDGFTPSSPRLSGGGGR